MHARLLWTNVGCHLLCPERRRLSYTGNFIAIGLCHNEFQRMTQPTQSAGIDLLHGQWNGTRNGYARSLIVQIAGATLRASKVAQRKHLRMANSGLAKTQQ